MPKARPPFKKLLVANRGEIALRVVRACRELGISTVAVYSEADRNSLHVRHADEAYLIGPASARESYLNGQRILKVAGKAGVDALHPGYGFLAENAEFAEACLNAGITFVGPPPEAIRLMGDKVAARDLVERAGIPVVPGSVELTEKDAAAAATRIGFPILIKATAGGGGKGIRAVHRAEELPMAFAAASQEAESAFGNGALYLEKFLEPVRHIEIQIIADQHGNVVPMGERECSIQRRHQKMIEEAPSAAVNAGLRRRLSEMAVSVARAANYVSLGTVEFLLGGDGNVNFLEVNTRLQVEHPVTEMVTGIDLVADQIRVAAGEKLPYSKVSLHGWAIECRIAAEDPFNNFLPSVGTVSFVSVPGGPGVRVDSAIHDGLEITYHYDPLIAKLCTWGRTREEAIQRMQGALQEFKIVGVSTNIPFHLQVMADRQFRKGKLDTRFLERRFQMRPGDGVAHEQVALVAAAILTHRQRSQGRRIDAGRSSARADWRLGGRSRSLGDSRWAWRGRIWRRST